MKKIFFLLTALVITLSTFGQGVDVGNFKGIRLKGGTAARVGSANGNMYYNTSTNLFMFYQNGAWVPLGTGGSTTLSPGHIFVGNGSSVATDVALSGGATISSAGVLTVTTNANLNGDVISTGNTTTYNNKVPISKGGSGYSNLVLPKYVPLFVFIGESNSGGFAVNSDATAGELAPRPQTRIYNPLTHTFQTLQIGVNNLINHTGLANNASHGWELELANQLSQFDNDSIYIVKCGQGGSTIAQWTPGVTPYYYDTAVNRVRIALNLLKAQNKQPQIYILYSQGINDGSGTQANTWVSGTKTLIANIRSKLGNVPVLMTQLVGAGATYNSRIQGDICRSFNNVYYIKTPQSAVGDSLRDVSHWSYIGMKKIAQRMVTMIKDSVGTDYDYLRNLGAGNYTLNSTIEALGSKALSFRSATIEAMRLTTTGKVQIGGSSTAYALLSVGVSSNNASQFQVHKGSDDGFYILSNSAADSYLQTGASFNGTNFIAKNSFASIYNMGNNGSHIFNTNVGLTVGNSYTPTQRVRIDATGLKIGTGSPTAPLDVTGVITATGNIGTTGGYLSSGQSANSSLFVYDRVNASNYSSIYSSSNAAHLLSQAGDIMTWDLVTKYINVINRLGIAQSSPTAYLHLGAGTGSANTGALKFTNGTQLTTPENLVLEPETLGENLLFTNQSGTRHTVAKLLTGSATLDFTSTSAQSSSDLTVTVTGAAVGDEIVLGAANSSVLSASSFSAWVSAANTVTIRFNNYSSGALDPASGSFRVSVIKR